jgi:hypothetical protein
MPESGEASRPGCRRLAIGPIADVYMVQAIAAGAPLLRIFGCNGAVLDAGFHRHDGQFLSLE